MGFLRDFYDSVKQLADINKQFGDEMRELITDGFKEIVIKGNSDYNTSYEKNDYTDEIISRASKKIDEVLDDVKKYYDETNSIIAEHNDYKKNIVGAALEKYHIFTIDFAQIKVEIPQNYSPVINSINTIAMSFSSVTLLSNIGNVIPGFSMLNPLGGSIINAFAQRNRVAVANIHLAEAEEYRSKTELQIELLYDLKTRIAYIRNVIADERNVLDKLIAQLQKLTIKLSNISAERSYSVEELKGLSSSVEIAKAIIDLLSSEFLSNECEITEQYLKATENLKKLENKIEEERVVWE
jgi:hypothetical protein